MLNVLCCVSIYHIIILLCLFSVWRAVQYHQFRKLIHIFHRTFQKEQYLRLLFARREDTCDLLTQELKFIFLIRQLRGLRRVFAAARFLESWVRISLTAWIFFSFVSCLLSGRVLCFGLITRPEESYRM
jgi:hypothetical protein